MTCDFSIKKCIIDLSAPRVRIICVTPLVDAEDAFALAQSDFRCQRLIRIRKGEEFEVVTPQYSLSNHFTLVSSKCLRAVVERSDRVQKSAQLRSQCLAIKVRIIYCFLPWDGTLRLYSGLCHRSTCLRTVGMHR